MKKVSKSPQRNTFQKEGYLKRQAEKGKTPENDEDTRQMLEWYEAWDAEDDKWASKEQKDDMEYDLRTTQWILEKVRNSEAYAQNLYAAMCNMQWIKREVWPILSEQTWSCSWRSAGGIIANMREEGDYIDWYCSGIGNDDMGYGLTHADGKGYVPEGHVTEEIELDLYKLGWLPRPYKDE